MRAKDVIFIQSLSENGWNLPSLPPSPKQKEAEGRQMLEENSRT
jgi:hypothetical protein